MSYLHRMCVYCKEGVLDKSKQKFETQVEIITKVCYTTGNVCEEKGGILCIIRMK